MDIKLPVKNTLTTRLYFGFAVSFILVAVIGLTTFLSFRKQIEESHRLSLANSVIAQVDNFERLLVDMETGKRGYRVTNDENFLEPYNRSIQHVHPTIDSLRKLLSSHDQTQRLDDVDRHVEELLDFWNRIDSYKSRREEAGSSQQSIVRITREEKIKVDRIREELQAINSTVRAQLSQRQASRTKAITFISYEVVISTIVIELIIIVLSRIIVQEFKKRRYVEERLHGSLEDMERLNKEEQMHNWLLKGTTFLRERLHGVNELQSFSERTLKGILEYLDLPAGVFYVFNEEENILEQYAAVGLAENNKISFSPDQGLVGAAARSKKIGHVKNVPTDYWKIRSGMGAHSPGELLVVPYFFDKELKGVLEVAAFRPITEAEIAFLESLYNALGIGINACKAHDKMMHLMDRVHRQNEELEQQQEELRQTNEELTRQTEHLQASEEELRVHEEELRQINAELEEKNEVVESARHTLTLKAQELERATKYKSEFLANMSHELRTPLNSVLILAKLLKENKQQNLLEKQVEYATIIHKSGTDLLELINDILDLSKIEAGKVDVIFEKVKIANVVDDMKQLFATSAEEKGVLYRSNVMPGIAELLYTDKQKLEQIIKNLLSNAFKFTPKGGQITLTFRSAENEATTGDTSMIAIDVADTGIGIPEDKQQVIFEAFQQADGSTSRKFGGTGLGLSISKELVRLLKGRMKLSSEPGKGSCFTILIPAVPTSGMAVPVQRYTPQEESMAVPLEELENVREQTEVADDRMDINKGDRTMLIIDDDKDFASIIRDFARKKGYKTIVALQGDEGIHYALKYQPSAITLDMQLPVIHGKNVLKTIKTNERLKEIPIHIISGTDANVDLSEAIAFLHKPIELDDLEHAFALIGKNIKAKVKNVLIVSGKYVKDIFFDTAASSRSHGISYDYAQTDIEAQQLLSDKSYDCIIADIGNDIQPGIDMLQNIQSWKQGKDIPVIIYLDKDLSGNDELRLKKFSDAIIRDSSFAHDRLMDELELFLYKIQEPTRKDIPVSDNVPVDDAILHGKKVLLTDDDMRNVFAISTLLEEHQMEVYTAADGREAIQVLKDTPELDIVLMDIMMPEMDGYEAMKEIRKDRKFADLPIIALTAKAMAGDQEKAIAAGASDYITKPVDSNRLFSLMRVWLSK